MLALLLLLHLVLLLRSQHALAVASASFDSREAGSQGVTAGLVALATNSSVHTLIHAMDLVLGLRAALLGDATIAVARRAQVLRMAGQVVTARRAVLVLALVPECTSRFGIGVVHLLCWVY